MSQQTVIEFPQRRPRQSDTMDFSQWQRWAEVELSVLGYDLDGTSTFGRPVSGRSYDWRDAFGRNLAPQAAAAEAAAVFQNA
jgi:hypothetical protein